MPLFGSVPPGAFVDLPLAFGVACGLEGLYIVRDGEVVVYAPPYDTPAGFSYGRFADTVGEFTITVPTPGEPNVLPDYEPTDPGSAIYDPFLPVATINITLAQSSIDLINNDPCGTATLAARASGRRARSRSPRPARRRPWCRNNGSRCA